MSGVAFEKGDVARGKWGFLGGGLVVVLQTTEAYVLQRSFFHANFKKKKTFKLYFYRNLLK